MKLKPLSDRLIVQAIEEEAVTVPAVLPERVRNGFIADDRPDVKAARCMSNASPSKRPSPPPPKGLSYPLTRHDNLILLTGATSYVEIGRAHV